jgi:hypothetical protein
MMKKLLAMAAIAMVGTITSCQTDDSLVSKNDVSQDVLDKIHNLGFSTQNVQVVDGDYLVEGDILISTQSFSSSPDQKLLRIAETEQYRTNNLVSGSRVITVSVSSRLPASYVAALDEALGRYNALGLRLTFQRVSSGATISLVKGSGNYLASSGFPTSSGAPYSQVKVNSNAIGSQPQSTVASIFAHEIGHCIGFRHTDYMDRSYSCGGSAVNEGASTVGAVLIPGTPSGPDAGSWMLSCIGSGQNRPFNSNDKTALNYLY